MKNVCHVIVQYVDDNGWAPVSISRFALEGGMSENTARDALDKLEAAGELSRKQSKGGRPSRYYLLGNTPHGEWLNPSYKEGLRESRRSGKGKATLHHVNPNPSPGEPQPFTGRTPKIGFWSSGSKKEDTKEEFNEVDPRPLNLDSEAGAAGERLSPKCSLGAVA
ncbi:MAG: hypothetical protein HY749_15845 [Gammaproteobacteria bacterium]|nr:hypothetical protein [Gammaproteobacteria bacterium]